MDLIERYLAAVERRLPEKDRADIVSELRDVLYSQAEEKEASLGRKLSVGETEDLLRRMGHPYVVGARYGTVQHIIGPEVFPFFWPALRMVLIFVLVAGMVDAAADVASGERLGSAIGQAAGQFWMAAVFAFGVVTLVFMVLEHYQVRYRFFDKWRPRDLPRALARRPRSWFDSAAELAANLVFLLWWTGRIDFSSLWRGHDDGVLRLALSPMWDAFHTPILVYILAGVALNLAELLRPAWERANEGVRLILNLTGVGILLKVLGSGPWVVAATSELGAEETAEIVTSVNLGVSIGFASVAGVLAVLAVIGTWRLARRRR